jgi:hypothetical protein
MNEVALQYCRVQEHLNDGSFKVVYRVAASNLVLEVGGSTLASLFERSAV